MALFEVPGWSVPGSLPSDSVSRKRKRPSSASKKPSEKLQHAEVNIEKLMKTLDGKNASATASSSRRDKRTKKINEQQATKSERHRRPSMDKEDKASVESRIRLKKHSKKEFTSPSKPFSKGGHEKEDSNKPGKMKATIEKDASRALGDVSGTDANLTTLQRKMKQSLDGARFRWINETLYKSSSKDAEGLMKENPELFEEYHTGFRHQVRSWPSNPLEHFKKDLVSHPPRSVIVDLGCGDASLARDLIPKGLIVLSYDLVAANPFIVAADICAHIPLPGSEEKDEGQIVDVVVCSLSLMSTNWLNCIREARRILKPRGELKIAEVASRIEDVEKFTSVMTSAGFGLTSKDQSNSHFIIFNFRKTKSILNEQAWQSISSNGDVLQPCEYKKR